MLRCLYVFGFALFTGVHVWMEHPEDPKGIYPSIWATHLVGRLVELGMRFASFDQCQFGGTARKPTTVMSVCSQLQADLDAKRCTGGHVHARTTGINAKGGYFSTSHAKYQAPLCSVIASSAASWQSRYRGGFAAGLSAWSREWKVFGFPLEHSAASGPLRVYSSSIGFQQ